jgi:hypothetical protein
LEEAWEAARGPPQPAGVAGKHFESVFGQWLDLIHLIQIVEFGATLLRQVDETNPRNASALGAPGVPMAAIREHGRSANP